MTKSVLAAATHLVRAGRLGEAVQALQRSLAEKPEGLSLPGLAALKPLDLLGSVGKRVGLNIGAAPQPAPVVAGARFEAHTFGNAAGQRAYKLYVPSGYDGTPVPLIVMLHGCTQSPDDFAAGTRMNAVADAERVLVAYPEQTKAANASKCWNWFEGADQHRDRGEPSIIAGLIGDIARDYAVDRARVYVAGLSAGGAAAAVMASTYPDVFAAVGVHSGLACGAAQDMASAFAAMGGHGGHSGQRPPHGVPTIVFHGDADRTVNVRNGEAVRAQAILGPNLPRVVQAGEAGGLRYTKTTQVDDDGVPRAEHWLLHGAGHAWSGGSPDGSYTDTRGPDASREMMKFFLQHRKVR